MELVKGVPITKYCDEKQLSLRERLELFKPVCEAVQHAHQKGIIHRDLKPTNVLVAEYDNRAVPKVIDFGVAKATAQKLTERTMFTEFGQVIGTVEYMSPEQAKFNQLDIDTRSDIYSLGVLLYELLTGSTPFDRERLRTAAFDEVLRIIREEEPPKPSTRLSQIARPSRPGSPRISRPSWPGSSPDPNPAGTAGLYDSTAIAANRHTEPARLNKDVRGELDWIVMKCLEKDRNRRYETANGLARDIERHLADEPVQACPPSAGYRFRKFARRNKAALITASAAMAMLVIGFAGLAISNRLISAQRSEAEAERQRAEENLLRARTAVRDILYEAALGRGDWAGLPANFRALFADRATAFYKSLLQEKNSNPSLQYETAVGYRSLATLQDSLQRPQEGVQFARESTTLLDRLAEDFPNSIAYHHQQAYSHYVLGSCLKHAKQGKEAELELRTAFDLYAALIKRWPGDQGLYSEMSICFVGLLPLYDASQSKELAARQIEVIAARPDLNADPAKLIESLQDLVNDLSKAAQWSAAEATAEAMVKAAEEFVAQSSGSVQPKQLLAKSYRIRGGMYRGMKRYANADADLQRAVEIFRETAAAHPDVEEYKFSVAAGLKSLGLLKRQRGQIREAEQLFREAIELRSDDAEAINGLGNVYWDQGRLSEAVAAYRDALKLSPNISGYRFNLAKVLSQQGKSEEAEAEFREVLRRMPDDSATHRALGNVLVGQKEYAAAEATYRKALELRPDFADCRLDLSQLLHRMGKPAEAEEEYQKALQSPRNGSTGYNQFGVTLLQMGRLDDAAASFRKAIELQPLNSHPRVNLSQVLLTQGKVEEALKFCREWVDVEPDSVIAYARLGDVCRQLGDRDGAMSAWRKCIELDARYTSAYDGIATLLVETGKSDEAVAILQRGLKLLPKAAELHAALATVYQSRGEFSEAEAEWQEAVKLQPDDAGLLNSWAWALATAPRVEHRDSARAVEIAQKAVELDSTDGNIRNTLGVAQLRHGEYQEALETLKKAIEMRDGGDSSDWYFVAMAYWRLGKKEEAHTWFGKADAWMHENAPNNEELVRFRAEAAELLGVTEPPRHPAEESAKVDNQRKARDE